MDIVHVYARRRRELGRQCFFSDRSVEMMMDIPPKPEEELHFVQRAVLEKGTQASWTMSEHQVNTKPFETESRGINHVEGGWPKDISPGDVEQTMRFRKKAEKDEDYINAVVQLGAMMEEVIKQNNTMNIYEDCFEEQEREGEQEEEQKEEQEEQGQKEEQKEEQHEDQEQKEEQKEEQHEDQEQKEEQKEEQHEDQEQKEEQKEEQHEDQEQKEEQHEDQEQKEEQHEDQEQKEEQKEQEEEQGQDNDQKQEQE